MIRGAFPVLVVLLTCGGTHLQAQHTLEIGPAVGIYLPLRNFAGPVNIPLPATVTGVWSQKKCGRPRGRRAPLVQPTLWAPRLLSGRFQWHRQEDLFGCNQRSRSAHSAPNTLGAVFGLRADFPLVTRLRLAFRTGVLVYRFGLQNSGTEYKPSTQIDVLGAAVVTYGLF
jgi:hypothetical protein